MGTTETGVKYDNGKPQYSLLPAQALLEVVKVLTFGAGKYAPDNWRRVPEAERRYFDAANRHMWQWAMGEEYDEETKLHHLASSVSNLLFILQFRLEAQNEKTPADI